MVSQPFDEVVNSILRHIQVGKRAKGSPEPERFMHGAHAVDARCIRPVGLDGDDGETMVLISRR